MRVRYSGAPLYFILFYFIFLSSCQYFFFICALLINSIKFIHPSIYPFAALKLFFSFFSSLSLFSVFPLFLLSFYLSFFLVASVRPSVCPSVMIELESVKTRISAPAHPSATGGRESGLVIFKTF